MTAKNTRIPLRIRFSQDYQFTDELLRGIHATNAFSVLVPAEEYYGHIAAALSNDHDPSDYVLAHEPLLDGTCCVEVTDQSAVDNGAFLLDYLPESTALDNKLNELLDFARRKYSGVIQENSGLSFYKKFLNGSSARRKELAFAYFLANDYQAAMSQFTSIKKQHTEYCSRIIGWCKILLGQPGGFDYRVFDILLLHNNAGALYYASKHMPPQYRTGVEHWLSGQALLPGQKMLILYSCLLSSINTGDQARARKCLGSLKDEIKSRMTVPHNRGMWESLYRRIESEFLASRP